MFGLKVAAPVYRIFKAVFLCFQNFDRFRICQVRRRRGEEFFKPFNQTLIKEFVEEFEFLAAFGQKVLDDIAEHIVGQLHVVFQIGERDFRLNHPEFSRMALRVGMLCAEGRPKRIDFAESHRHRFAFQLTGNGQRCGMTKEILAEIHFAVFRTRNFIKVQRRHAEHFACAFAVAARDKRRVHVDKAAFIEKLVNGKRRFTADAESRAERVGACPQVRNGAEVLHGVFFLLKRIIRRRCAFNRQCICFQLKRLRSVRRQNQAARHDDGGADVDFCGLCIVRQFIGFHDNLDAFEAAAVIQFNKAKGVGGTYRAHPAGYANRLFRERRRCLINIANRSFVHCIQSFDVLFVLVSIQRFLNGLGKLIRTAGIFESAADSADFFDRRFGVQPLYEAAERLNIPAAAANDLNRGYDSILHFDPHFTRTNALRHICVLHHPSSFRQTSVCRSSVFI